MNFTAVLDWVVVCPFAKNDIREATFYVMCQSWHTTPAEPAVCAPTQAWTQGDRGCRDEMEVLEQSPDYQATKDLTPEEVDALRRDVMELWKTDADERRRILLR